MFQMIILESFLESNGMGNGILNDDSVTTSNINMVTQLYVNNLNIKRPYWR